MKSASAGRRPSIAFFTSLGDINIQYCIGTIFYSFFHGIVTEVYVFVIQCAGFASMNLHLVHHLKKRATLMIHFLAFPSFPFESQFAPSNQFSHSENSADPIRRKALGTDTYIHMETFLQFLGHRVGLQISAQQISGLLKIRFFSPI